MFRRGTDDSGDRDASTLHASASGIVERCMTSILAHSNLESEIALILNEPRENCHAFYNSFGEHGLAGIASGYWTVSVKHSSGCQPLGFESLALRGHSTMANPS